MPSLQTGFWPMLKRCRPLYPYALRFIDVQIGMFVCSLTANAVGVISPYLTKLTFDYAYANRDWQLLLALALCGLGLTLLSTVSGALQQYLQIYASQNLAFALRSAFLRHMYRLPMSYFESASTGERIYRLSADVDGAASFIGGVIPNLVSPVVSTVFPLCAVLWLDWRFAVLAAAMTPIYVLHSRYFGSRQRALSWQLIGESQAISSQTMDRMSRVKLVRTFGRERYEIWVYLRNQIKLMRFAFRRYWLDFAGSTVSTVINSVMQGGLALYMGYRVVTGEMSVGTLIALSMYYSQLLGSIRGLAGLAQGVMAQMVPAERVLDVLEQPATVQDKPGALSLNRVEGHVEISDVRFGYAPDAPVLDGLSLSAHPGEMVAIVGPSGAGKTTILGLLLRLYDPDSGRVRVDGHDVSDLKVNSLRSKIGVALQETNLFNASVAENIRYGNQSATDEEIEEAARLADAHEFIMELPDGYDTIVGEDGSSISAGQRQRIGIARALVRRPRILLLDEATASLSTSSEARILDGVRPHGRDRTVIVITHRLAAIHRADRICVLDQGRIVETGTHNELLALDGLYRTLWDSQFGIDREAEAVDDKSSTEETVAYA